MLLIKLEGEFFGQYKKLGPIYFPENNVIGILGPNGAGKSTIFSAIELALYGNASHIKMSEIKNHDATKGQKWWVELIFELGGFQYKVFRHETTSKAYLSVNGKTIQMGQTEVTEHIENAVLQMDQVAFSNAFYAKQDEFDQLNRLTNEQRKKQISKLLKVHINPPH
jgi:exonuclease SbcC